MARQQGATAQTPGRAKIMTSMKRIIVSALALCAASGLAVAQEMKTEIGAGEGQVDIVPGPATSSAARPTRISTG
jgi:hypothetical protein